MLLEQGKQGQMISDAPFDAGSRPRVRADIVTHILDDELIVYDPETSQSFALNSTARVVWMLCDGTHTLGDIVDEVTARIVGSAIDVGTTADVRADVAGIVSSFVAAGLCE